MRRAAIIFNPSSAHLSKLRRLVAARELADDWAPSAWIPTTDAGPADALVDEAVRAGASLIVAAGGDGTVRAVGSALAGRDLSFAVIPVGTANLLARNLGLPLRRLEAAVRIAFGGAERALDLATVDYRLADGSEHSRPYFVMAGFGVDSDMVAGTSAAHKARLGWAAYVGPIVRSMARPSVDVVTYSLDGAASVTVAAHSFVVGNGGTITAGIRLLPHARLDDGRLDVLVLRSMRGRDRASIVRWLAPHNLPLLREGRRERDPAFRYAQATAIDVQLAQPTLMQADGDLLGLVAAARFSVRPAALRVRAPGAASAPARQPELASAR